MLTFKETHTHKSPKSYKHPCWRPACWNCQHHAHHLRTSANVPFNWTLKRISAGKQRGPAVATLDCIKGHLESVAALHSCLSLLPCQRQQVGTVLTCLLRTRKNTPFESQSSGGGWPSWSLSPAVCLSYQTPEPRNATLYRSRERRDSCLTHLAGEWLMQGHLSDPKVVKGVFSRINSHQLVDAA